MRDSAKRVVLAVLNFRMGGQLSSLIALRDELTSAGINARILLPRGVPDLDKATLADFGRRSPFHRLRAMSVELREQAKRPDEILHLVLPSPGFSAIARLLGLKPERTLIQWEGFPLGFDREFVAAFRDDPLFLLPRFFLNHKLLHWIARVFPYHQLVSTARYLQWLAERGHRQVSHVPNLAQLAGKDFAAPTAELSAWLEDESPLIAYIGHAHPVKGVDDLLSAFLLTQQAAPSLRLLLALSPDGNAQRISRRVGALSPAVKNRILLTGMIPIACVLQRAEALALPYRSLISTTLLPSLLLEADAAGCPVIVSDIPDLCDVIPKASESWHLVPAGNPAALADRMRNLPRRPQQRTALMLPGIKSRVRALIKIYEQIAEHPKGI